MGIHGNKANKFARKKQNGVQNGPKCTLWNESWNALAEISASPLLDERRFFKPRRSKSEPKLWLEKCIICKHMSVKEKRTNLAKISARMLLWTHQNTVATLVTHTKEPKLAEMSARCVGCRKTTRNIGNQRKSWLKFWPDLRDLRKWQIRIT